MARNVTFKKAIAIGLAGVAVTSASAWGLAHFLVSGAPVSPKRSAVREVERPQPPTQPVTPAAVAAPEPSGEPMLFKVRASLSTADGPEVSIEAVRASEPCTEPRWLDVRNVHMSKAVSPLNVKSEASWCVRVMPGQRFVPQTLDGRWLTLADRTFALDAAHQYMRVQHASGKWLGVRVIAAGYCASETSACSGTTLVEISVDDRNLIVPVAVSSKNREVLRLTREDEIPHTPGRAAAPDTDAIEVEEIHVEPQAPAAQTPAKAEGEAEPAQP